MGFLIVYDREGSLAPEVVVIIPTDWVWTWRGMNDYDDDARLLDR